MEAIAPYTGGLEPAGNRHDLGHAGHVVMKCRIKARNLGQVGITVSERLDQLDLARQVIRVTRTDLSQFLDQLGRDTFGLMVATPAMNDSMSDAGDFRETDCAIEPIDQQADSRLLIRGIDPAILVATAARIGQDPAGLVQPDPIDATGQEARGWIGLLKEPKLEAR